MNRKKKAVKSNKSAGDGAEMICSPKVVKKKVSKIFEYCFLMELDKEAEVRDETTEKSFLSLFWLNFILIYI